jgi:hypothetical protein
MKRLLILTSILLSLGAYAQYDNGGGNGGGFGDQFGQPDNSDDQGSTYTPPGNVGTGGVELSEIPVSVSSSCDSVILKGTRKYNNTAFLMPKAKVAKDENGEYLIEVVKQADATYNLRMTITFANVIRDPLSKDSLATKIVGCDYEELKFKVNNYLSKSNSKVDILATLPVSNIAVTFKLNGKVYRDRLGEENTNSLNYLKQANIVEFKLNRSDIDEFIELVNGRSWFKYAFRC